MGKIVAVANQKGGVGKTTTCINLSAALAEAGVSVLLCDMDPQGNATSGLGIDKNIEPNIYNVLIEGTPVVDAVVQSKYGDVLPANKILSGAAVELVTMKRREFVLKNVLATVRDKYDYILVDCPPSLEMLTLNSLCAADTVLIPVQCEYFALEGLTDLMMTLKMIKKSLNTTLEIEGVLLTMYDSRTNFSAQVAAEIKKYFGKKTYNVVIPRNIRLSEAPSHGVPIIAYDRPSRGSIAYMALAKEVCGKNA